jgi:hypothetical protein
MTTLEKAARASYESHRNRLGFGAFPPWDEMPSTSREVYIEAQRAAISAALLDPSDEVVNTADREFWATEGPTCVRMRAALRAVGVKITGKD